jgi:YD repeat-containing protein
MVMAAREMGKTLFESAEYAARNTSNHVYVQNLYETYLLREPDSGGWAFWESLIPTYGREQVRRAFDESGEFIYDVSTVTPNGNASSAVTSLLAARVDPFNQSGNQIMARDAEWSASLLSLPGRAGLDLGLGLSYSSAAVWTRSGPYIYFDEDNSSLSPGFRLGFPTVQELFFNAQISQNAYLLITSAGNRVELRETATAGVYEAADSSYLQLTENNSSNPTSLLLRATDGTQMSYSRIESEWRCTQIKDRNGNFITVNYNSLGDITTVVDTLNRTITFNYDGNANPISITQTWNGQTHTWATFGWDNKGIQPSFSGVALVGIANASVIPVLSQVGLDDGNTYVFNYPGTGTFAQTGIVASVSRVAASILRAYTAFDYTSDAGDPTPRIGANRVWAENWNALNGVPSEVTTQYAAASDNSWGKVTAPNGTVYKEFYATSGWQKRLATETKIYLSNNAENTDSWEKRTTTAWTQDNTSAAYQINPRATETDIYDGTNHRRTTIGYTTPFTPPGGTSSVLLSDVYEWDALATTVLRRTHTDYNLDPTYLNRWIIGLTAAQYLCDAAQGAVPCNDNSGTSLLSKVTLQYDETGSAQYQGAPVQHDETNYGSGLVQGRANLSSMRRYDVTTSGQWTVSSVQYNTAGSVITSTDPASHQSTVSYTDAFSADGVNPTNLSFSTLAYPTTVTDADGNSSFVKYHYDFGAKTRVQGPPPAGQSQGIIQTFAYDNAARIQQVTTTNNGAYTRYVYGPYYVQSWSSVNNVADDAYAIQTFDGLGRVIGAANNHPGSTGGYKAQVTVYDQMGRAVKQSNPAEINGGWVPSGDDGAGWLYTQQTYDWKGRPQITTNTDTTTKTASYGGCGCAGGEVVTLTDEVGRKQKVYSDALSRTAKSEIYNSDGTTVYSTIANTYNARDQVTLVRQYQGADTSGVYQDTTATYDGYGRLGSKHVPEQNAGTATTFSYNLDDTTHSVTDARGASATYSYNNRHLVTGINYSVPAGVPSTPNVAFGYDGAGNRTSMSDGAGGVTYSYNQLSQMTSETRSFSALPNSFTLTYGYNLAGQLASLTDPFNGQVTYQRDSVGRVQSMGASGYVAAYFNGNYDQGSQPVTQIASGIQYRAWGAVKQITYGNGVWEATSFNSRLQPTQFDVNNVRINNPYAYQPPYNIPSATMTWTYDYFADGRAHHAYDQQEHRNDRRWEYDHAGRLQGAYVNHGARGEADPNYEDMYRQTIQYDAWNHITSRTGMVYNLTESDTATYVNNRRQSQYNLFTYDPQGNLLADTNTHKYNAESRQTHAESSATVGGGNFPVQPAAELTQTYDGLGGVGIHDAITRQEEWGTDQNGDPVVTGISSTEDATYDVRSTVLGGALVTEVVQNYQGQGVKRRTSFYLNGQRIARDGAIWGSIEYEHNNPVNGSWVVTNGHPYWRMMNREERDPFGADMASLGQAVSFANLNEGGNAYDWIGGCAIHGMPAPCEAQVGWMNTESVDFMVQVLDFTTTNQNGNSIFKWTGTHLVPASSVWNFQESVTLLNHSAGQLVATPGGGYEWVEGNGSVLMGSGSSQDPNTGDYSAWLTVAAANDGYFAPQKTGVEYLPLVDDGYAKKGEDQIRSVIASLLQNERCRRAFEIVGLQTINQTVEKGIVIGAATWLREPSNKGTTGIVEGARQTYWEQFSSSYYTRGGTISQFPGEPNPFSNPGDRRPRMFLARSAFERGWLKETIIHEFIHAGGQPAIPSRVAHDLYWYDWYDFLQDACQ